METENVQLVENGKVQHLETNTGQVYDFASGKWLNEITEEINMNLSLKTIKSNKDSEGIFTTIETFRKSDNTLYQRSVLSGGESPNYTTRTITKYGNDGIEELYVDVYTLAYDSDGILVSEV